MVVSERRRFAREQTRKEVYCYVEGQRLDAETANVSPAGVFVVTPHGPEVEDDSMVSLSFRSRDAKVQEVFLFGRVQRVEAEPLQGLALRWERAVTTGPRVGMVTVLRDILGISPETIQGQRVGNDGKPSKTFVFEALDGENPGYSEQRSRARAELIHSRIPTSEHDWKRYPSRGPITRSLQAVDAREAVTLKAVLVTSGARKTVRITSLGSMSVTADMKGDPGDLTEAVALRFNVPIRTGTALVTCNCVLQRRETDATKDVTIMEFAVESIEEGDRPGVLERYVRWLHQRSISKNQ